MPDTPANPAVLLIAESANTIRLARKHLSEFFSIQAVSDGEAAWELLQQREDIDVIVCDLGISVDAFGLLERLRGAGDAKLAATPVLLLVGESDSERDRDKAFASGATDFVNLPFSTSELVVRVRLLANAYAHHSAQPVNEMQTVAATSLLQQLSQADYFDSRVQQEVSFSLRHRTNLSLARLSLDNMQAIIAGFDKVTALSILQAVARIIQETIRREDTLCYFGDAEFGILYPATNGIGAAECVNRIRENLASRTLRVAGKKVRVTLSAAVYSWIASEETDLDAVYASLDKGLQQAAAGGGNRVVDTSVIQQKRTCSIDRALALIESGKTEEVARQAQTILRSLVPLLEFVDGELDLDLQDLTDRLRERS